MDRSGHLRKQLAAGKTLGRQIMLKLLSVSNFKVSRPSRAARHLEKAPRPAATRQWQVVAVIASIVFFLCFSHPACAANFTASLDRDTISLGESATLTLTFENGQPARMPSFPAIPNLRIQDAGGEAFRTVNINGQMSSSRTHTFAVSATQVGKYTIPPLSVEISGQTFPASL